MIKQYVRRVIAYLNIIILVFITVASVNNTTVYAGTGGTIYPSRTGYYYFELDGSRYRVDLSIGTDQVNTHYWVSQSLTLLSGPGGAWIDSGTWTFTDGAEFSQPDRYSPGDREYRLHSVIHYSKIGYHVGAVASAGVQSYVESWTDNSVTLFISTNDCGITNWYDDTWNFYHNTLGLRLDPNTHTVAYDANGGTGAPSSQTKTYGSTINLSTTKPTKTGYTFTGWNTKSDGTGTAYASGATYGYDQNGGTITLYAQWSPNAYNCYFNANGGTLVGGSNPITFTYDSNGYCLGCAPSASRTGYNFIGWYGTADGGNKMFDTRGHWYNVDTGVADWWGWQPDGGWYAGLRTAKWVCASNATVYAHWTPKTYTLYINPNGGTYSDKTGESTKTMTFDSGNNNGIGTPSRTGYTFKGWYTSATGGEPVWDTNGFAIQYQRHTSYWKNGDSWDNNWMGGSYYDWTDMKWNYDGNIRVYAHWEPIWYDQVINYYTYTASGKYDSATHTWVKLGSKTWSAPYDSTFDAASHKADWGNVSGYHWWSINNNNWKVTGPGATNSHYYPNTYRLNVDLNKGSGSTTPSGTSGNFDMEYGTYKDLGSPTRVGYIFNNWKITSNNTTNSSLSNNKFTMGYNNTYPYKDYKDAASVKIAAQWTPITYKVRFNGNGNWNTSQGSYTQQFTYDVSGTLIPNKFTRPDNTTYNSLNYTKGYEFIGWGTSATQKTATYTDKQTVKNLKNTDGAVLDLYAIWKKPITLTFNFNGGKFNNNGTSKVLSYTMYNSELSHTFDIAQYYGTLAGTGYNSKGLNTKLTKTDTNGIQYRFLGYSLNKNATVPDTQFDVYSLSRTENYTIRDNTTLYAVWEPVLQMTVQLSAPQHSGVMQLTSDVPVTTTLGNFKIPSGTRSADIPSSATASVNTATIGVNVTNEDLVSYTVSAKGASSIKFSTAADSRILDIYNHGKNNPWFDNLNEVKDFNYSIDEFSSTIGSFTIPQYLGTTQSYQTSNPDLASGTAVYGIKFTCTQPSYYYSKYWNSPESTSVYGILFLNPTLPDDNTNVLPPYAVEDGAYEFETILN